MTFEPGPRPKRFHLTIDEVNDQRWEGLKFCNLTEVERIIIGMQYLSLLFLDERKQSRVQWG